MQINWLSKLTKSLIVKIVSIIIAIAIWHFVKNFNSPIQIKKHSAQLKLTNKSYRSQGNHIYRITDNYQTLPVYIKGYRSKLQKKYFEKIKVMDDLWIEKEICLPVPTLGQLSRL